ncbi:MAG: hypothetical protein JWM47_852 [Acidimicrobiales bacterium]|nr:hypothetical protein [Acidimicrobiales bacterium]
MVVTKAETWPGDFLLHPLSVTSIVVLIVNDRYVKERWPGFISGKLSDVAGLIFFPLLLVALAELVGLVAHRPRQAGRRAFVVVSLVVGVVFAATKTLAPVRAADEIILGWLQWLPRAIYRVATGSAAGSPVRQQVVVDLLDLMTVPCVLAAVWIGGRYRPLDHCEHADHVRQVEA